MHNKQDKQSTESTQPISSEEEEKRNAETGRATLRRLAGRRAKPGMDRPELGEAAAAAPVAADMAAIAHENLDTSGEMGGGRKP